jgi:CRP/FNR family transcriptional regulator, cyclic AMP receptor protein
MRVRGPSSVTHTPFSSLLAAGKHVRRATGETVFSQGEDCSDISYIEHGVVELTVYSNKGRRAVVGLLGPGDFFGEECLLRPFRHRASAITLMPSSIITLKRRVMSELLMHNRPVSTHFINYVLARNRRLEDDLIDHIFNSSEKRLARILLLVARYSELTESPGVLKVVTQEMIADMVGTTRSRINYFMNKFRKLDYIQYNGGLTIRPSLSRVLGEDNFV